MNVRRLSITDDWQVEPFSRSFNPCEGPQIKPLWIKHTYTLPPTDLGGNQHSTFVLRGSYNCAGVSDSSISSAEMAGISQHRSKVNAFSLSCLTILYWRAYCEFKLFPDCLRSLNLWWSDGGERASTRASESCARCWFKPAQPRWARARDRQ